MRPLRGPFAIAPTTTTSIADLDKLKDVIAAARKGRDDDANAAEAAIKDPVARILAEWVILRSDSTQPNFQRYVNFINAASGLAACAAVPAPRRERAVERRCR